MGAGHARAVNLLSGIGDRIPSARRHASVTSVQLARPGAGDTLEYMEPARALLVILLAATAIPAAAAVVRLKDGGRLEGGIVSATALEVVIQTAAGARRITADRVQSIEYESGAPPSKPYNPAPAWSDYSSSSAEGKNIFSFGLGLAAPLSDVNFRPIGGGSANNGDLGPLVGVRYLRALTPRFAAGADLDYLHRGATNSPGLLPLADASVLGDNILFMGIARWYLIEHGAARPYLLGGAGASRSWTRIEASPIRGFAWTDTNTDEIRRLVDDSAWAFASTARLGIDFDWEFANPSVFSLEAGWTAIESRRFAATKSGRDLGLLDVSGPLNLFMLSARWSWRW